MNIDQVPFSGPPQGRRKALYGPRFPQSESSAPKLADGRGSIALIGEVLEPIGNTVSWPDVDLTILFSFARLAWTEPPQNSCCGEEQVHLHIEDVRQNGKCVLSSANIGLRKGVKKQEYQTADTRPEK
jgi:hypothetical protein